MINSMTASKVRSAYGGESQAYMRYKAWGKKAEHEGYPNVARLFYGIAFAEEIHAKNHFKVLKDVSGDFQVASTAGFGLKDTLTNLERAKAGEDYEIYEMYPAYRKIAEMQNENEALQTFDWALAAEKNHSCLFQRAMEAVSQGYDMQLEQMHICKVCGHTTTEVLPAHCPICQADKKEYKRL